MIRIPMYLWPTFDIITCMHSAREQQQQGSQANNPSKNSVSLAPPKHLLWNIDSFVGDALVTAENNASKTIDNLSSVLLHYNSFGSDFMKRLKCSPDGFLQMAYQLAYYRQHGEPCATYESASTRMFKLGRTETVRSCSVDTVAFTKAWDDKDVKVSILIIETRRGTVVVMNASIISYLHSTIFPA